MPKQLNSDYNEVRIPFAKMSFTPDVPSPALGPNEYNDGINIESDVRGIRSVAGDMEILESIPGTPTFVTGGFRRVGATTATGTEDSTNGIRMRSFFIGRIISEQQYLEILAASSQVPYDCPHQPQECEHPQTH